MDKDDLLSLLGKMPTKAELAFKVIEEVDCGKFILKKINYSAEAGEIISAFLCIPPSQNTRNSNRFSFFRSSYCLSIK